MTSAIEVIEANLQPSMRYAVSKTPVHKKQLILDFNLNLTPQSNQIYTFLTYGVDNLFTDPKVNIERTKANAQAAAHFMTTESYAIFTSPCRSTPYYHESHVFNLEDHSKWLSRIPLFQDGIPIKPENNAYRTNVKTLDQYDFYVDGNKLIVNFYVTIRRYIGLGTKTMPKSKPIARMVYSFALIAKNAKAGIFLDDTSCSISILDLQLSNPKIKTLTYKLSTHAMNFYILNNVFNKDTFFSLKSSLPTNFLSFLNSKHICFTKFAVAFGYKNYNPIDFIAKKIYDKNPLARDLYANPDIFKTLHIEPQFNFGNFKSDFFALDEKTYSTHQQDYLRSNSLPTGYYHNHNHVLQVIIDGPINKWAMAKAFKFYREKVPLNKNSLIEIYIDLLTFHSFSSHDLSEVDELFDNHISSNLQLVLPSYLSLIHLLKPYYTSSKLFKIYKECHPSFGTPESKVSTNHNANQFLHDTINLLKKIENFPDNVAAKFKTEFTFKDKLTIRKIHDELSKYITLLGHIPIPNKNTSYDLFRKMDSLLIADDKLEIVYPETSLDMVNWGAVQKHCIGSAHTHNLNHTSYIYLGIRIPGTPENTWVGHMQISYSHSNKIWKINQFRAAHNAIPEEPYKTLATNSVLDILNPKKNITEKKELVGAIV